MKRLEKELEELKKSENRKEPEVIPQDFVLETENVTQKALDRLKVSTTDMSSLKLVTASLEQLQRDKERLQQDNQSMKRELEAFDISFFDELEDLKYQHKIALELIDEYETLIYGENRPS